MNLHAQLYSGIQTYNLEKLAAPYIVHIFMNISDRIRKNMPAGFRLGLGAARIQA